MTVEYGLLNTLGVFVFQGLSDSEEFVIHKALTALQALVEMSLLPKPMKYEFLKEVPLVYICCI